MSEIKIKTYTDLNGELVKAKIILLPAVMKSIPTIIRTNNKGTEWRLVTVDLTYPDGIIKSTVAQLFEKSYEMYPDNFAVGQQVELEVQIDGDGAGYAKVQLPSIEKIDFAAFMNDTESILKENLVEKELVI